MQLMHHLNLLRPEQSRQEARIEMSIHRLEIFIGSVIESSDGIELPCPSRQLIISIIMETRPETILCKSPAGARCCVFAKQSRADT